MFALNKIKPIYLYGIGAIPLALALPFLKEAIGNPASFVVAMVYFLLIRYLAVRFGRKSEPLD